MSTLTNDDFRLLARFAEPGLHPVPVIGADMRAWVRLAGAGLVAEVKVNGRILAEVTELGRGRLDHWLKLPALPAGGTFGLTPRQRQALDFIKACAERGQSPTYDEIALGIGFSGMSKAAVARLVECLVERGCIARLPHRARSIKVLA